VIPDSAGAQSQQQHQRRHQTSTPNINTRVTDPTGGIGLPRNRKKIPMPAQEELLDQI
jgi:hypothetical protein